MEEKDIPEETEETKTYGPGIHTAKTKKANKSEKKKTDKHGEPQGWYLAGSMDLELRKGKKSHQTRDGGLGSSDMRG